MSSALIIFLKEVILSYIKKVSHYQQIEKLLEDRKRFIFVKSINLEHDEVNIL